MRTLLLGIAIAIAGATAVPAQTLPFYNADEANKKECEEAGKASANSSVSAETLTSICMSMAKGLEREGRDELAKNWGSHDSSIRLQCIGTRWVVGYASLKQCIEQMEKAGPYRPQTRP